MGEMDPWNQRKFSQDKFQWFNRWPVLFVRNIHWLIERAGGRVYTDRQPRQYHHLPAEGHVSRGRQRNPGILAPGDGPQSHRRSGTHWSIILSCDLATFPLFCHELWQYSLEMTPYLHEWKSEIKVFNYVLQILGTNI